MDNIQPLSRFYGALQLRLTGEAQAPIQSEPGDLHRRLPLGSMAEHFLNDQHNPGMRLSLFVVLTVLTSSSRYRVFNM